MKPTWQTDDGSQRLYLGDCLTVLSRLEAGSVQCCITSPPYFALRSYLPKDHADKGLEIGSEPTPEAFIATINWMRCKLHGRI